MTDDVLREQILVWADRHAAPDDRARFACIKANGSTTNLMLRDIRADIDRDGNHDWTVEHTDPAGHTWTARSDTYTGAVLNLLARMCGLDGEIRGFLPATDESPEEDSRA